MLFEKEMINMVTDRRNTFDKILLRFNTGFILVLMLLAGFAIEARGQVISGRVVDSETGDAVSFTSVYLSGTTVGTVSCENGEFELDISRHPSIPLTVSAIGYSSVTLGEISPGEFLEVSLTPRLYEITPVDISTRSLERARRANLRVFRNQLLGRTSYARRCEILNEEDITFNYGSDRDTLIAYALKPLQIRNDALGFMITFHLERFEFYRKTGTVLYTGTFIFQDSAAGSSGRLQERRRKNTYHGSIMHFFRALWENDLTARGFSVQDQVGNFLSKEDIVIKENGQKYLMNRGDLTVNYFDNSSYIRFLEYRVPFEESGYFDPLAIMLTGEMGKKRVGDALPIGFVPR